MGERKIEYTIKKRGELTGISTRALRYYDEIGFIQPKRINSSGYQIYGEREIDILQQILFYWEIDMPLKEIIAIIHEPSFDIQTSLIFHRDKLLAEKSRLEKLIETVNKTSDAHERKISMKTEEKIAGFKENWLKENEQKYGKEIREKYGEGIINQSNAKLKNLSETDSKASEALNNNLFTEIRLAIKYNDDKFSALAKKYYLHQAWLKIYPPHYSKEIHHGIVRMYVEDMRFTSYYEDKCGKKAAKILQDAIITNI